MKHLRINHRKKTQQGGFTLIEILIVLTIIAVFVSTAVVNIDQVNSRRLGNQVHRLEVWFETLSEESALTGQIIGIVFLPSRNTMMPLVFAEKRWRVMKNIKPYQWTQSVEMKLLIADKNFNPNTEQFLKTLELQNEKVKEELLLEPEDEENQDVKLIFPNFFLAPLQTVMPKTQLIIRQDNSAFELSWDAIGDVIVTSHLIEPEPPPGTPPQPQ